MKEKSTIILVKKPRSKDALEEETVTLVLAEALRERDCFVTPGRKKTAAQEVLESLNHLWIFQLHEGLAFIHLLKDFTDVSYADCFLGSQEMTCMEQAVKEERCERAMLLWDSWGAVILKVSLILVKLSRSSHLVFVYDTAEFLLNPLKVVISVTLRWMKSKKSWMTSQRFDGISVCACIIVYSGCRESCTVILLVYG